MRIAFISYEFPPETLGGIGTYARHAVTTLLGRGHDITVFAGTEAKAERGENWHGAVVFRLPAANRLVFYQPAVARLVGEHARTPFDVAEVPDLYAEGRGLRALLPDLPIVLRTHTPLYIPRQIDFLARPRTARYLSALRRVLGGLARSQSWRQTLSEAHARVNFNSSLDLDGDPERQVALEADLVAPPSQRLAQRLLADWHLPGNRLRVVPYPHLPAPELLQLAPTGTAPVRTIGFHGGVRLFKGVHVLVAAMRTVLARHPNVRLTLAGASGSSPVANISWRAFRHDLILEWRDTLEWLQPQLHALGDRVIVRGFVPPGQLAGHLADADLCVFPSLFDNFPSACLEAMSAGRAIVATRSGGMEEMLGDDEGGLLVLPGDAGALAAAICRIIEDPELRTRVARRARERILTNYSAAVIGPLQEALYLEAIQKHRR